MSSSELPMDVLLEISARSDPVTLVRCAATCKVLRRHIADPDFRPPLRLRHADQFVPALFRGFFFQNLRCKDIRNLRCEDIRNPRYEVGEPPRFVVPGHSMEPSPEPFHSFLSKFRHLFKFYHPVSVLAVCRGLVALRSNTMVMRGHAGPCVVMNPMTGYFDRFRPPGINAQSFVLITGDGDDDGHYRLLAAELASGCLKTQAFSPVDNYCRSWQAIAETAVAPCPQDAALLHPPVVLQGDAHWLCRSNEYHFVLTFSCAQLQASVTKIDGRCGEQLLGRRPGELLLVSDGQGRQPRLLVATGLEISLWTLSDSGDGEGGGWSKQVLVEPERIRLPGPWSERLELRWFGEKSGYVFVRMAGAEESSPSWYFMLELAARRVRGVLKVPPRNVLVFFPYEMDLSFWRPNFTYKLKQL